MAFVSEVVAKMRVDKSGVDQELTAVAASFAKAGESIDKQLSKGFGFKKMAKGLLQGLGIGSASDIKEAITKPFEDAAKAAKDIEESTAATLKIYQEIFASRRTDEQNLEANRREQASLQKELAKLNQPQEQIQTGFNLFTGKPIMEAKQRSKEDSEKADAITKRLAELSQQEFALKDKIGKTEKANEERRNRNADEFAQKEEAMAQKEEDFLRSQMSLEDQLADLERERIDLAERMSMSDEDKIALRDRTLDVTKEIARIEKEITAEAEKQKTYYEKKSEEIFKASDAVTKSRADYATELMDRSGWTVGEVANQKMNWSSRNTARNIQRLEEQAKRVRIVGGDFRDPQGRKMSREEYAKSLTERALQMRDSLKGLKSQEADPMAALAQATKNSENHLKQIEGYLKPGKIK